MANVGFLEVNFEDHPTPIFNSHLIESFYNENHIQTYVCVWQR